MIDREDAVREREGWMGDREVTVRDREVASRDHAVAVQTLQRVRRPRAGALSRALPQELRAVAAADVIAQ